MTIFRALIGATERLPLPDAITRAGIAALIGRTHRKLETLPPGFDENFAADMARFPIAEHPHKANIQHYEVPAAFFELCLGPRRKYSCCHFEDGLNLAGAEDRALELTCEHADLADGQSILELGCGWGSLTLWMAEHYPKAKITAVSNSHSQRAHIEAAAQRSGLENIEIVTADMNIFETSKRFDRIVSVEMFEHMANWDALLERSRRWLSEDGLLFIHVFTHCSAPYRFDRRDPSDWIAQHFFTGGLMPSRTLIRRFSDLYSVVAEWSWSGMHYARTANGWLTNFDRHHADIERMFSPIYGSGTKLWMRRWRLFFLATEELFGYADGDVWSVSHYLLKPAA